MYIKKYDKFINENNSEEDLNLKLKTLIIKLFNEYFLTSEIKELYLDIGVPEFDFDLNRNLSSKHLYSYTFSVSMLSSDSTPKIIFFLGKNYENYDNAFKVRVLNYVFEIDIVITEKTFEINFKNSYYFYSNIRYEIYKIDLKDWKNYPIGDMEKIIIEKLLEIKKDLIEKSDNIKIAIMKERKKYYYELINSRDIYKNINLIKKDFPEKYIELIKLNKELDNINLEDASELGELGI